MSQHLSKVNTDRLRSEKPVLRQLNDFMESPWFVALICLLTLASSLLGMELIVYTLFVVFAVYIAFFGRDFLPLMPLVICAYISPSISNNPGRSETSVFYPANGGIYIIALFCTFVVASIIRVVMDKEFGGMKFLKAKRTLLPGMLILGAAYMLGGILNPRFAEFGARSMVFALIQFVSIAGFYWFFSGAVHWERVNPQYFAWVGLGAGLTVCGELAGVFVSNHVIEDSIIVTGQIFTGWGNANNVGCMIAMMVPFAVCLATRNRGYWVFYILGVVMLALTCLTCSRTSIAAAFIIYAVSMIPALCDKKLRWRFLILNGITLLLLIVMLFVFQKQLDLLFEELRERGMNPRMRDSIYPAGIRVFQENPIFGEGFFPSAKIYEWSNLDSFKSFFPARWHNTVIQLLASCGIVGLLAYAFHRVHTVVVFYRQRKCRETMYIGFSIVAMLMMSLLDCHFFNVGPALFYSMGLAFAEHIKNKELS